VLQGASSAELKQEMIAEGINTLRMSGINKILDGVTTVEEICRVTVPDKS
jgi:type IV pilus assembly protein PilB